VSAPRVRFAPSPTGYFHVGSARTSLFNWLFARQHAGVFVLRIEDTDTERNREEWVDGILDALGWLGLDLDEGPFRQSERSGRHRAAADALWDAGVLYACDCRREDVVARTAGNATPGYDGYCRDRGLERGPDRALRFRTAEAGTVVVTDLIRGEVVFPLEVIEDFVVVRSTGEPLFLLANVVDDRDMAITHVIRGEEHLPNTPKAILLWRALDDAGVGTPGRGGSIEVPVFAHLPLLVNEKRQKLSKRRDPVAVELYRDQGYLPEAFRNYLALLGWSPPGEREKVPLATLIEEFRLEQVHNAPAFFDVKKLGHLNGEYVRELSTEEFVERSRPWVAPDAGEWAPGGPPPWPGERFDPEVFAYLAPFARDRVVTLGEVPALVEFAFVAEAPMDETAFEKAIARDEAAPAILRAALERYAECPWEAPVLHEQTQKLAEEFGRKLGKAQAPIRVAVMGRMVGLPLFESMAVLGRDETRRRIAAALDRLPDGAPA
jgi:glutamyl-tRNA synthetase